MAPTKIERGHRHLNYRKNMCWMHVECLIISFYDFFFFFCFDDGDDPTKVNTEDLH